MLFRRQRNKTENFQFEKADIRCDHVPAGYSFLLLLHPPKYTTWHIDTNTFVCSGNMFLGEISIHLRGLAEVPQTWYWVYGFCFILLYGTLSVSWASPPASNQCLNFPFRGTNWSPLLGQMVPWLVPAGCWAAWHSTSKKKGPGIEHLSIFVGVKEQRGDLCQEKRLGNIFL